MPGPVLNAFKRGCLLLLAVGADRVLVVFIIGSAATLYTLNSIPRYTEISGNLVARTGAANVAGEWWTDGDSDRLQADSVIRLNSAGRPLVGKIAQQIDTSYSLYRLTADVLVSGAGREHTGGYSGVSINFLDSSGNSIRFVPVLRFLDSHDWLEIKPVVEVPANSRRLELAITSAGQTLDVQLRAINLHALQVTPRFQLLSSVLFAWISAMAIIVSLLLLARVRIELGTRLFYTGLPIVALAMVAVLYFALTSKATLGFALHDFSVLPTKLIELSKPWAAAILQVPVVSTDGAVAKLMHFGFFASFGFAAAWIRWWRGSAVLLLCGAAMAVFTETMQKFQIARSGSFADVGLNLSGLLAGLVCFYMLCAMAWMISSVIRRLQITR